VERQSDCDHFGSVDWRTRIRIKVSGHLCNKCPCDLVGWCGDLARVASWRWRGASGETEILQGRLPLPEAGLGRGVIESLEWTDP
jgi:hypothetical protein